MKLTIKIAFNGSIDINLKIRHIVFFWVASESSYQESVYILYSVFLGQHKFIWNTLWGKFSIALTFVIGALHSKRCSVNIVHLYKRKKVITKYTWKGISIIFWWAEIIWKGEYFLAQHKMWPFRVETHLWIIRWSYCCIHLLGLREHWQLWPPETSMFDFQSLLVTKPFCT